MDGGSGCVFPSELTPLSDGSRVRGGQASGTEQELGTVPECGGPAPSPFLTGVTAGRAQGGKLSLSSEALEWLRGAVDAVAESDPQVAAAGRWGKVALLNAWHTRLTVALQKGNAACLLQAGRVRGAADFVGASGWEEDVEDLLRDAAAAAGVGGLEAY